MGPGSNDKAGHPADSTTDNQVKNEFSPVDAWLNTQKALMESWTAGAASIARATAEQLYAAQESALRFMNFSARAWEAYSPQMDSEALQAVLVEERGKFLDEWGGFPLGFSSEEFSGAVGDINQLWQLYLEQWQKFGDPWTGAFQGAPEYLLRATSGDSGALKGLSDLYRNAYQDTLGRIVTSPNLGPTRELNEKLLYSFDAWFDWQMATLEYQSILSETWQQAMEHFMGQLVALAEKGESITSIRDLTTLWTRGAEEVFTNAFRTEKYVLAQGRMLNAAMQYRIQQRAILEVWLKAYDLPTRAELDEAHRRIYELRKEVKGLKRELAALKQSPVDAGAAGRRKTPQRRQRKSDQEELGG